MGFLGLGAEESRARLGRWLLAAVFLTSALGLGALHTPVLALCTVLATVATGLTISGFWSLVNERWDPHAVRKIAGSISAGSALGGLAGGLFARYFGAHAGPGEMLPVLTGASLFGGVLLRALSGRTHANEPAIPETADVRSVTASSRALLNCAVPSVEPPRAAVTRRSGGTDS